MRVDFEELRKYTGIDHKEFDTLIQNGYANDVNYLTKTGDGGVWFYRSSPYLIFDIMCSRDIGIFELWYDYIKRRIDRRSSVFDYGAGVGSLEVMLLKRSPHALTAEEHNLLCMDFVYWRMQQRGVELVPRLDHYDYVVSLDTLQRLPPDEIKPTLSWLLSLGDRCFIFINEDGRHPLFNKVPFEVESFLRKKAKKLKCFHGLYDITMEDKPNEKEK